MNKSDHDLLCKLCAPTLVLNHLLPPARNRASFRTRGHSYQLPEYSTDLHKNHFLSVVHIALSSEIVFGFVLCTIRHSDFAFYVYYMMRVCRI